jgi:hypothetical protein
MAAAFSALFELREDKALCIMQRLVRKGNTGPILVGLGAVDKP